MGLTIHYRLTGERTNPVRSGSDQYGSLEPLLHDDHRSDRGTNRKIGSHLRKSRLSDDRSARHNRSDVADPNCLLDTRT